MVLSTRSAAEPVQPRRSKRCSKPTQAGALLGGAAVAPRAVRSKGGGGSRFRAEPDESFEDGVAALSRPDGELVVSSSALPGPIISDTPATLVHYTCSRTSLVA